jgi:purine-cytosine permease-like protein
MDDKQNWRQLSSIQIGGVICLPVVMIGHILSQTYGFFSAVISIFIGNALLVLLGLVSAKMSYEKGKTTVENAQDYFGEKGVAFFSIAMAVSLTGWFAIQLNVMSLGVLELFSMQHPSPVTVFALNVLLGLLITGSLLYGMKGLNTLANISLPILIFTLVYALFTMEDSVEVPVKVFSLAGVSPVIAMAIACIIDLPTYFRHARTSKDGMISIVIIFGAALPLLEILGVYLASGIAQGTILDVLSRNNSTLWNMWIALFLILAGWTTNNLNLYSTIICLESIFKKSSRLTLTLVGGAGGTLLSCMNLLDHLEIVLEFIGILVTSMGAVIITRYFIDLYKGRKTAGDYRWHLFAWFLGIAIGILSHFGLAFTSIPVLDATIGAIVGTLFILVRKSVTYSSGLPS